MAVVNNDSIRDEVEGTPEVQVIKRLDQEIELLEKILIQMKTSENKVVRIINIGASIAGILGLASAIIFGVTDKTIRTALRGE